MTEKLLLQGSQSRDWEHLCNFISGSGGQKDLVIYVVQCQLYTFSCLLVFVSFGQYN